MKFPVPKHQPETQETIVKGFFNKRVEIEPHDLSTIVKLKNEKLIDWLFSISPLLSFTNQ